MKALKANQAEGRCVLCGFSKVYTSEGKEPASLVASKAVLAHRAEAHPVRRSLPRRG